MTTNATVALILAPEEDLHARSVQQRYQELYGDGCVIMDTSMFPEQVGVTISPDSKAEYVIERRDSGQSIAHCKAIWRRRPKYPTELDTLESSDDQFIARNSYRLTIEGWLHFCTATGTRIMNDPAAEFSASNKIHQLFMAGKTGFAIPRTTVSNSANAVREFCAQSNGSPVCYKPFQSPPDRLIPTAVMEAEDFDDLHLLSLAPTIFQDFIAGRDIRATVVGDSVFAVEIVPRIPEARTDWRVAVDNEILPYTLLDADRLRILSLMSLLRLEFGALDFKLVDDNLVFLEVNPGGQFLFAEIHTGAEISAAIATWLHGDHAQKGRTKP